MALPDPPNTRMRRSDSAPRRRATDPELRRRAEDHKAANSPFAAIATVVVALGFLSYVFNVAGFATAADSLFTSLDISAKSQNDTVVSVMRYVIPGIGILLVALVLAGLVSWVSKGAKNSQKKRNLAGRDLVTLEQFKEITAKHGIRPRIATQAYQLLLPFYRSSMRARLSDSLIDDLHMKPAQIEDVYGNLLRNTDRKAAPGESHANMLTVLDLLTTAQNAKRQSLMDSMVRPVKKLDTPAVEAPGPDRRQRDGEATSTR